MKKLLTSTIIALIALTSLLSCKKAAEADITTGKTLTIDIVTSDETATKSSYSNLQDVATNGGTIALYNSQTGEFVTSARYEGDTKTVTIPAPAVDCHIFALCNVSQNDFYWPGNESGNEGLDNKYIDIKFEMGYIPMTSNKENIQTEEYKKGETQKTVTVKPLYQKLVLDCDIPDGTTFTINRVSIINISKICPFATAKSTKTDNTGDQATVTDIEYLQEKNSCTLYVPSDSDITLEIEGIRYKEDGRLYHETYQGVIPAQNDKYRYEKNFNNYYRTTFKPTGDKNDSFDEPDIDVTIKTDTDDFRKLRFMPAEIYVNGDGTPHQINISSSAEDNDGNEYGMDWTYTIEWSRLPYLSSNTVTLTIDGEDYDLTEDGNTKPIKASPSDTPMYITSTYKGNDVQLEINTSTGESIKVTFGKRYNYNWTFDATAWKEKCDNFKIEVINPIDEQVVKTLTEKNPTATYKTDEDWGNMIYYNVSVSAPAKEGVSLKLWSEDNSGTKTVGYITEMSQGINLKDQFNIGFDEPGLVKFLASEERTIYTYTVSLNPIINEINNDFNIRVTSNGILKGNINKNNPILTWSKYAPELVPENVVFEAQGTMKTKGNEIVKAMMGDTEIFSIKGNSKPVNTLNSVTVAHGTEGHPDVNEVTLGQVHKIEFVAKEIGSNDIYSRLISHYQSMVSIGSATLYRASVNEQKYDANYDKNTMDGYLLIYYNEVMVQKNLLGGDSEMRETKEYKYVLGYVIDPQWQNTSSYGFRDKLLSGTFVEFQDYTLYPELGYLNYLYSRMDKESLWKSPNGWTVEKASLNNQNLKLDSQHIVFNANKPLSPQVPANYKNGYAGLVTADNVVLENSENSGLFYTYWTFKNRFEYGQSGQDKNVEKLMNVKVLPVEITSSDILYPGTVKRLQVLFVREGEKARFANW